MAGIRRTPRLVRRTVAIIAAISATLAVATAPAVAATPGPAACQEYSVCGGPTGGSGTGGSPGRPSSPRPSVGSRTTLPLTGYPLTPALAILAGVVALALAVRVVIGVLRRARRRGAPTSVPAR